MEILGSLPLFHSESMRMRKGWSSDGELNNGHGDGPQLGPQTRLPGLCAASPLDRKVAVLFYCQVRLVSLTSSRAHVLANSCTA